MPFGVVVFLGILVAIAVAIPVVVIIAFIQGTKNAEEEKAKKEAEKEAKKKKREWLEEFLRENGILSDWESMNSSYNGAARNYICNIGARPVAPTYTRGVMKGSLADNVSVLANAQKKQNYDAEMQRYNNINSEMYKYIGRYKRESALVLRELQEIPGSEQYLEYATSIIEGQKKALNIQ